MSAIDIHYVDAAFRPSEAPITVVAMTKAAARTALVAPRHETRMPAMPTCACDRCRSCLH